MNSQQRLLFAVALVACGVGISSSSSAAKSEGDAARSVVRAALEAMGGEDRLRSISTLRIKGIGHRYMREQSERPEGPWILDYFQIDETRDVAHGRLRQERQSRGCDSTACWRSAEWSASTLIFDAHSAAVLRDGQMSEARASVAQDAAELLAFSPERVLLNALAATDLHGRPDVQFHGLAHRAIEFSHGQAKVRVLVSRQTMMPSAVEWTRARPYDIYWSPWGDVTTRVSFAFWMLEPGGLRYPRAWSHDSNGRPDWNFMINELALDAPFRDGDFAIPEEVAGAFERHKQPLDEWVLGDSADSASELAPGVIQIRGAWNVAEIRQADGIVILEGPISNGYSRRVLEDVARRFPGVQVKAVISTSDAWPHIGGLREYVARGIPIYALDLNRPILEALFSAPHQLRTDTLSAHPHAARLTAVSRKLIVGSGANRFELIPLRTTTGERQMAVYFPEWKLLYSSDLVQRSRAGAFPIAEALYELMEVANREQIDIVTDFGMHLGPTSWRDIVSAVEAAR